MPSVLWFRHISPNCVSTQNTTVKGKSDRVPLFDFKADAAWETTANRLPSRQILHEKHLALHGMIKELLDLKLIKPKETSWSQVHLVHKPAPSNGWRFTIDYTGLNKVSTNQVRQITNMSEMLQRMEILDLSSSASPTLRPIFSKCPPMRAYNLQPSLHSEVSMNGPGSQWAYYHPQTIFKRWWPNMYYMASSISSVK